MILMLLDMPAKSMKIAANRPIAVVKVVVFQEIFAIKDKRLHLIIVSMDSNVSQDAVKILFAHM